MSTKTASLWHALHQTHQPTHSFHPASAELHAAAAGNIVAAMSDLDGFTAKLNAILSADLTHAGALAAADKATDLTVP